LARLADSGADEATLDELTVTTDGSVTVATTQVLRADRLPGLVTQLHRGDLRMLRRETWGPLSGDTAAAQITASIPDAPVKVTGSGALRAAEPVSRADFTVRVEVRIPLVGGKVESFIGGQLVDLLGAEQRFTSAWVTRD
jgi:hypothetical protein